jgi:hypothetical protein
MHLVAVYLGLELAPVNLGFELAPVNLGLEVLRERLDGIRAGQDGVGARFQQFVTLPAGHRAPPAPPVWLRMLADLDG